MLTVSQSSSCTLLQVLFRSCNIWHESMIVRDRRGIGRSKLTTGSTYYRQRTILISCRDFQPDRRNASKTRSNNPRLGDYPHTEHTNSRPEVQIWLLRLRNASVELYYSVISVLAMSPAIQASGRVIRRAADTSLPSFARRRELSAPVCPPPWE